jgi:regulatory protein
MIKIEQIEYKQFSAIIKFTGGKQFEVNLETPGLLQISSGQDIEDELFEKIVYESSKFDCEKKALRYISMGMKSELETVNYLKKKKFENEIINQVIIRLKELNYIDDRDFAFKFADYKMRAKIVGLNLIKNELLLKGVKKNIIEEVLTPLKLLKRDDEVLELALKKFETVKDKKNSLEKVKMFLISRGFDFDEITSTLRIIKSKMKSDDDFEL